MKYALALLLAGAAVVVCCRPLPHDPADECKLRVDWGLVCGRFGCMRNVECVR